jgi:hypothetical protein
METKEITAQWVIDIIEDERHRQELAQMIAEVEAELNQNTKKIIPKKPFK